MCILFDSAVTNLFKSFRLSNKTKKKKREKTGLTVVYRWDRCSFADSHKKFLR